jgi:hypothetical protein
MATSSGNVLATVHGRRFSDRTKENMRKRVEASAARTSLYQRMYSNNSKNGVTNFNSLKKTLLIFIFY